MKLWLSNVHNSSSQLTDHKHSDHASFKVFMAFEEQSLMNLKYSVPDFLNLGPASVMVNVSLSGSEDCGFESRVGLSFFFANVFYYMHYRK